jgi:protein-tyrosine phosphatase
MSDFSILCVCTGNICRSPAAERLLSVALGSDIEVASAGTLALAGRRVDSPMDRLVVLGGGDVSGFVARQLREPMLRDADLVLTMTDAHTGDVIEMWPRAVRKTFTIGEFARLLGSIDQAGLPSGTAADRLRAAIPLAAANRRPVADRTRDDIVDPYRQDDKVYEQAFDDIRAAVSTIAAVIVLNRQQERL